MKIFLLIFSLLSLSVFGASKNVGIILKKQGQVELLSNPNQQLIQKGKTVLYEGLYYSITSVRPGMKIQNGNILRTGAKSKARIVYKNGDQFNVGQGTAYKVSWKKEKGKKTETTVDLIYGSLRGVVSKKGPRNNLKVKSRTAVMGVRGTDFYFSQKGSSGKTEVSVLRGKVELVQKSPETMPLSKEQLKRVEVPQGFSAELISNLIKTDKKTKDKSTEAHITLNQTSKHELLHIQKESKVVESKADKVVEKEVIRELKQLERQAITTTLEDIKEYQPEVYEEIKKKKVKSIDVVNTTVVAKAFKKAPLKKAKKSFDDLDIEVEDDAYDKYFSDDE